MSENANDYQATLNLPTTDFAMKANLPTREPTQLQAWEGQELYQQIQTQAQQCPHKFVLHDGPPYANGHLHLGHAVNKILKDMILKSLRMSGYAAPYIPGWDCHGLPIELNVEKKIGKVNKDVGPIEFIRACRLYAEEQIQIQREEFKRLGVFGDWQAPYITMDPQNEAEIIRTLARIYERGYVKPGQKPVHWCLDCGSSLAEAEVEYDDKVSSAIDVRFTVIDHAALFQCFELNALDLPEIMLDAHIPIWTTTPWTLPANQAVAVHPTLHYVLIEHATAGTKEYLILAQDLMAGCCERYGITHYEVLATVPGEKLAGLMLQHPFYQREVAIILGEHITLDMGTGAVHTAPAHGLDDFLMAEQYGLPVERYLNAQGVFLESVPLLAGIHLNAANQFIIDLLTENGKLLLAATIKHSYPHCWRHKKPLIFMATSQWFISMQANNFRQKVLDAIETVHWIPDWGKNRISAMIANRPDWCISRQRTWGTPMTIFIHRDTGQAHPHTPALMRAAADCIADYGIELWAAYLADRQQELSPHEDALRQGVIRLQKALEQAAGQEGLENYQPISDTLDVWFDSGATYATVVKRNPKLQDRFPADLYLEGSDQHRGWFHTALLLSVADTGVAPYRGVLTHGFTVDEQGRKMSKSLGNVIAPEKVMKTYGADILRLWAATTDYTGEISISDQILQRTADTYRRMRNTARFLLANLNDFNPEHDQLAFEELLELDFYICQKAAHLQREIIAYYLAQDENDLFHYQFHLVFQKIHNFCAIDLGSFYLDVIKDRQYTMPKTSRGRRSAQTAIYHLLQALVRWLAPMLSFTAEEIWHAIPGSKASSVFLTQWYKTIEHCLSLSKNISPSNWENILQARDAVNKQIEGMRQDGKIGAGLEAEVKFYANSQWHEVLSPLREELKFVLITSKATVHPLEQASENAETTLPGLAIAIDVSKHQKCSRCWHRVESVGQHAEHPTLCSRCVGNITGHSEVRNFA